MGIERMAGQVEAQGVALGGQQLAQRPLGTFGQVQLGGGADRVGCAKQRDLAGSALAGQLVGGLEHLGQLQGQRGAVGSQVIQCTGIDHRLQRAPVELGRFAAGAEIQQ